MSNTESDSAEVPRTPSGDQDAATREDPIRRSPIQLQLLKTFVGVLAGMFLVDCAIAWYDSDQGAEGGTGSIMRSNHLGWTNKPGFENPEFRTRLDRFGLRNPEIPGDAPLNELRIAGFGASRVYGAGGALQPWCWNYKLEQLLADRLPHPSRVLNGGVMGYSALQASRRASAFLDAIEPDVLWILISPEAQALLDGSSAHQWVQVGDGPEDVVPHDVVEDMPRFLHGTLAAIHRAVNEHSGIYRRYRTQLEARDGRTASLTKWRLSKNPLPAQTEEIFEGMLRALESLQATCDERGTALRVLVFPAQQNDSDEAWNDFLIRGKQDGAPPLGTPRREPSDELIRILEERGIKTWDFFPEMNEMGKQRARYIMGDNYHWSELGHTTVARGIYRRMNQEGLLEEGVQARVANPRTRPFGEVPFPAPEQEREGRSTQTGSER